MSSRWRLEPRAPEQHGSPQSSAAVPGQRHLSPQSRLRLRGLRLSSVAARLPPALNTAVSRAAVKTAHSQGPFSAMEEWLGAAAPPRSRRSPLSRLPVMSSQTHREQTRCGPSLRLATAAAPLSDAAVVSRNRRGGGGRIGRSFFRDCLPVRLPRAPAAGHRSTMSSALCIVWNTTETD